VSLAKRAAERTGQVLAQPGSRALPITSVSDLAIALGGYSGMGGSYLWDEGPMGNAYRTTYGNTPAERIGDDFEALVQQAYKANGVVFAVMLARQMVFSAARFQWQRYRNGKPSDTFGTPDLAILDRPWLGGSTQSMLSRMIQDVDTAGNAFMVRARDELDNQGEEIVRLRPDWVDCVVTQRKFRGGVMGYRKVGYLYWEGGRWDDDRVPVALLPDEVAHWMPIPDPMYSFKGMSWLSPAIRDVQADGLMQAHKRKFFEHGATPNLVIKHNTAADPDKVKRFAEWLADEYGGVENAYKSLNLYPGADVTVVGADFRQIDFKQVQGGGETRIAADGGVPPVIVGLSEGLQAATYSNYAQARRRMADGTIHPLWQDVSSTLETLMPKPGREGSRDVRLWYEVTDVPFLREDAKDSAEIAQPRAITIKTYIDAGFTPESAVAAVDAGDERLLVHTGLVSVQLQPPGGYPEVEAAPEPETEQVSPDEAKARTIAELLPRVSTGVDKVISPTEGRDVLNLVGAGLSGTYEPPKPPAPAASGEQGDSDSGQTGSGTDTEE
jgi:phage portal protein BeeE